MIPVVVVNKKTYERKDGDYDIYIGRPRQLGNPYKIGPDGTREEVIDKYKEYFYKELETDPHFKKHVDFHKTVIRTKRFYKRLVLVCWCDPLPCHGSVIKEYLENDTSC